MANAPKRTNGEGGLMIKWNEAVSDRADEDLSPNCGPPFLPLRQKRTDIDANYAYH
jgi:hypothetical protein